MWNCTIFFFLLALENATPAPTQKAIKKKSKDADNTDASPSKKAKPDGQPEIFKCESCNVETNSKTQYEQVWNLLKIAVKLCMYYMYDDV